jgi:hypothetical protein
MLYCLFNTEKTRVAFKKSRGYQVLGWKFCVLPFYVAGGCFSFLSSQSLYGGFAVACVASGSSRFRRSMI